MENKEQSITRFLSSINMNVNSIEEFKILCKPRKINKNEHFLRKNQIIIKTGLITSGIFRVYTVNDKCDETNILFSTEGGMLTGNFVPGFPSDVNIQAVTEAEILELDFEQLLSFLDKDSNSKNQSLHLAAVHSGIQEKFTQMISMNAQERYLVFLEEYPNLINRIPHYHIANYLGISTTQLSRIRNKISKGK
jgi:CRP/FNR family transcriptional regulator, anaerobic regulatory protein